MQPDASLVHLVREPTIPSTGPAPLLLLLHGLGSNEADLFSFASELDGRFLVASARAPQVLSWGSFAWFNLEFTPEGPVIDAAEAEASRLRLLRFIDGLVGERGLDPKRVFLMGFSQGAIMGLGVALTRPDKVAGVVAMSGRLLPEFLPLSARSEQLAGFPLFVAHGTMDGVLPIEDGRETRRVLSALPVDLDYREYAMGHEINGESFDDAMAWLDARLSPSPRG